MLRELLMEPMSALYRNKEPDALGSCLRSATAALERVIGWE